MTKAPRSSAPPAVLATLLVALLSSACRDAPATAPRHLFFITVDTLRADHLSAYGYPRPTSPFLEDLASRGVLFERAIAQWPKTGTSFASIFLGQYPQTTGLTHEAALRLPDEYLTLPEFVRELGFETAAVVSNGVLNQDLGWHQGFDEYHETWKLAPVQSDDPVEYRKWLNARRVNELALPLLERRRDSERLFVWLHYSDPHAPYLLPEGVENPFVGDAYYTGDEEVRLDRPRTTALGDRRELRYYVAQYDANVLFMDLHVQQVFERARELGLLEDALIIFSADHGESLGEHGYFFGHGRLPYNNGVHVPLVFSYPGLDNGARRVAAPVELVDLYPTLRELLAPEREVPGLEGESLLPWLGSDAPTREADPESLRFAFSQAGGGSPTTHFRSVQDGSWKLIYHPAMGGARRQPSRFQLYHLDDDPGETRDLATDRSPDFQRLSRVLSSWMKGSDWIRRPRSEIEAHSQEVLDALRALGYVN